MKRVVVIAHDVRSTHNVGSLLRTAEGLGVEAVYFTGYTPHPIYPGDSRLPHLANKIAKQINKTALGAESLVQWHYQTDVFEVITLLKEEGFAVYGLEQAEGAIPLPDFKSPSAVAVVLGREVEGIASNVLDQCDGTIEIPMAGSKESFNVVQAAAMTLYALTFS